MWLFRHDNFRNCCCHGALVPVTSGSSLLWGDAVVFLQQPQEQLQSKLERAKHLELTQAALLFHHPVAVPGSLQTFKEHLSSPKDFKSHLDLAVPLAYL